MISENGYHCGLVGKLHLSRAQDRVEIRPDDGYDEFYWSQHPFPDIGPDDDYREWLRKKHNVDPLELTKGLNASYGAGVPTKYHHTTWCGETSVEFIKRNSGKPWLLSVNCFDPHPPFDPPEEYLSKYDKEKLPYPIFQESDIDHQKLFRNIDQQSVEAANPYSNGSEEAVYDKEIDYSNTHDKPPLNYDAREVKACYYASIELVDAQLGKMLDALEETGQRENTVIIFMSDHGELLGDHGLLYKGCRFYESLVRVPLIIAGTEEYLADVRTDALVELIDCAPTVLDIAGVVTPSFIQGESLYNLLTGKHNINRHKTHVISEFSDTLGFDGAKGSRGTMYFDGKYKMCRYPNEGIGELYDLENDPNEFIDLWNNDEYKDVKMEITEKHFDAMINTISTGIERTGDY